MGSSDKDDLPNSRLRFDIEWAGQIKILAQKYKMKRRPILAASTLYDFTTSTESLVLPYVVLICSLICSEKFPNNPVICFNLTFGEDRPDSCTTLIAPPCSIFISFWASGCRQQRALMPNVALSDTFQARFPDIMTESMDFNDYMSWRFYSLLPRMLKKNIVWQSIFNVMLWIWWALLKIKHLSLFVLKSKLRDEQWPRY